MYVGDDRQKLYEELRKVEDEITFEQLYKNLGWDYDKLYNVCKSVTNEFAKKHRKMLSKLESPELFNPVEDIEFKEKHFRDSLVDLAMLLEYVLPEIQNPKRERNPIWLAYRKMWLDYRGY
jgi:hypothetical protein